MTPPYERQILGLTAYYSGVFDEQKMQNRFDNALKIG